MPSRRSGSKRSSTATSNPTAVSRSTNVSRETAMAGRSRRAGERLPTATGGRSRDRRRSEPPARPSTAPRATPPVARLRAQVRPGAITVSVWLWRGAALVALAVAAAALTQFDRIRGAVVAAAAARPGATSDADLDRAANLSILVLIIAGVGIALLQFGFAAVLRIGRNWARTMLVVVAVVGVAYGLALLGGVNDTTFGGFAAAAKVGLLTHCALVLAATVAMFAPGTARWFRRGGLVGTAHGE